MANRSPQTVNLGGGVYTRQQLRQMFREGRKTFEEHLAKTPIAVAVRYDNTQRRVVVTLSNRCEMSLPIELLQEVRDATPKQLSNVTILPEGLAIEWPQLDQQFLVSGLLSDLGAPGMMRPTRRRGGRSKTVSKVGASGRARRPRQADELKGGKDKAARTTAGRDG